MKAYPSWLVALCLNHIPFFPRNETLMCRVTEFTHVKDIPQKKMKTGNKIEIQPMLGIKTTNFSKHNSLVLW